LGLKKEGIGSFWVRVGKFIVDPPKILKLY
jgi:hypothetical protein